MADTGDTIDIDFMSDEFQRNYKAVYATALERCPIFHASRGDFFAVAKYEAVKEIALNPSLWSSKFGPGLPYQSPDTPHALVNADPPQHTQEVKLIGKVFTKTYFDSLEHIIQQFVDTQIDEVFSSGRADLHAVISIPLPLFIICHMLGADFAGREAQLDEWVRYAAAANLMTPDHPDFPHVQRSVAGIFGYLAQLIEDWRKRLEGGEATSDQNLITRLLTANVDGISLTTDKILGFCKFLLIAGSRTTTILISNLIHRLLNEPEQLARVRADPELMPLAIEECLRVDAPVHGLFRTNEEPAELGTYSLPKDTKVMLLWAAGNLDPEAFDNPMAFDLDRDPQVIRKHLAFGHGIHICRGAPLARLEALVVLRTVLRRLPNLRADGPVTPEMRIPVLMGLRSLPVAWDI